MPFIAQNKELFAPGNMGKSARLRRSSKKIWPVLVEIFIHYYPTFAFLSSNLRK